MTRKSKVRYNRFRTYRLKLSPTTRAIRSALLGLAIAGAAVGPAMAGTCTFNTATDVDCEGVFDPGNPPQQITYSIDDLTIVFGITGYSAVIPSTGIDGIELSDSAGGYVDLTTGATGSVITNYADAISIGADSITVDAHGTITSAYGSGIVTDSVYDTTIISDGSIAASDAGPIGNYVLYGIEAISTAGDAYVTQNVGGAITVSTGLGTNAQSTGISADGHYIANIGVNGGVTATANHGGATGVEAYAHVGNAYATVANGGSVTATVAAADGGSAYGVFAHSYQASAVADSAGDVLARTYGYNETAAGLTAFAYYNATATNSGTVTAEAFGANGTAIGAQASAYSNYVLVDNSGNLYANADSSALAGPANSYATGASANSVTWVAGVINDGLVDATAVAGYGNANATGASAFGSFYGYVENADGDISAVATSYRGNATATAASATSNDVAKYNSDAYSTTLATASTTYGNASATAVHLAGYYAVANVNGDAGATATVYGDGYFNASATGAYVRTGGRTEVYVAGHLDAYAHALGYDNFARATGVDARSYGENGSAVTISGYLYATAVAPNGDAHATGIDNFARYGATSDNYGYIDAYAHTGDGSYAGATGISTFSQNDGALTYNTGEVYATAHAGGNATAIATGIYTEGANSAYTNNIGHVEAHTQVGDSAGAYSYGAWTNSTNGTATLFNDGYSLLVYASAGNNATATAVAGYTNSGGAAVTTNDGILLAKADAGHDSHANAFASQTISTGDNATFTSDAGSSNYAWAYTQYNGYSNAYAVIVNANVDASADSYGDITAHAYSRHDGSAKAYGLQLLATNGSALATNEASGDIEAVAKVEYNGVAHAYGVDITANSGLAYLYSAGVVGSYAEAGDSTGTYSSNAIARSADVFSANGDAHAYTYGAVNAFASVGDNDGASAFAFATGIDVRSPTGTALLTNGADVTVTARAGSYATAIAEGAIDRGYDYARAFNFGALSTYAYATDHSGALATAMQVYGSNGNAYFGNYAAGSLEAHARVLDYGTATAVGSRVQSNGYDASIYNEGHIEAIAESGLDGHSYATGSTVSSGGQAGYAEMYNFGYSMIAHAYAGDGGLAVATASTVTGALGADSYNHGLIEAVAGVGVAGQATATGSMTQSAFGDAYLYSDGNITADAHGLGASTVAARGAIVDGMVDATAKNYGPITATATTGDTGIATSMGIDLYAHTGYAYLYNGGDIYAHSVTGNGALSSAVAYGAIVTGPAGATLQGINGTVDAQANAGTAGSAIAIGALVNSGAGFVDVALYGFDIDAVAGNSGYAHAIGVNASASGNAAVSIYGDSHSYATVGKYGTALAQGVIVGSANGTADFDNYGDMTVHARAIGGKYAFGGTATAQGAYVSGLLDASAYSPGAIYVDAYAGGGGDSHALGITVHSNSGDGYLYNGTGIHAFAHGYGNDTAYAIGANVYGFVDATVLGEGNFSAGALSKYDSSASAVNVHAHTGDASLYSGSYITATSTVYRSGDSIAHGANVYGFNDAEADIVGTVDVRAYSNNFYSGSHVQAVGVNVYANAGDAYLFVGGNDYAHAVGRYDAVVAAIGASVYGYVDADVVLYGDVRAEADVSYGNAGAATAVGMSVFANAGDATFNDDGHVYAIAIANYQGTATATSAMVYGFNNADAYIDETISAFAQTGDQGSAQATGINVTAHNDDAALYAYFDVSARALAGSLGSATARGAIVLGNDYAKAYIDGSVDAYASAQGGPAVARGIDLFASNQDAYLYVGGDVGATALANGGASASAQGAYVFGYENAGAHVLGGISATASSGDNSTAQARGIDVIGHYGDAYLKSGYLYATATAGDPSTAMAQGGYVHGYDNADAYVYGNINAYAMAGAGSQVRAGGIDVIAENVDASLSASGDIYATAFADGGVLALAHGANVNGYGYATASVDGNINVHATAGDASQASARGIDVIAQHGDAYFHGGSDIYATAIAGQASTATAQGANVYAYNYATAKLYYGIHATASALDNSHVAAGGASVISQNSDAYLDAGGGIFVSASAGGNSTAQANGAFVQGYDNAYGYVGGIINASAVAGDTSTVMAHGIDVIAQNGDATLGVYYNIYANATAGNNSTATAIGANVVGAAYAYAIVTGNVDSYAKALDFGTATALGISVDANGGDAYLHTYGEISATAYTFYKGTSMAVGAVVDGSDAATAIVDGGFDVYAESADFGTSTALGVVVNAYGDDAFLAVSAPLAARADSGFQGTSIAFAADVNGYYYATALTNGIDAYALSGSGGHSTAIGITVDATWYDAVLHDYYGMSANAGSGYGGTSIAQAAAVTGYKYASATSEGDIYAAASTYGGFATAVATGITVDAHLDGAYLGAHGDIHAIAITKYQGTATALGASVHSDDYYAFASIDGRLNAEAYSGYSGVSLAQAVNVTAPLGDATLHSGAYGIYAAAQSGHFGQSSARGGYVHGLDYAIAYLYGGNVRAYAESGDHGVSMATGMDVQGRIALLGTFGDITAIANSGAYGASVANAASVVGTDFAGMASYGDTYAGARSYSNGTSIANGIHVSASAGDAYLYHLGDITAKAYSTYKGTSVAQAASVTGDGYAHAYTHGYIEGHAESGDFGTSVAGGANVSATNGDAYLLGYSVIGVAESGNNGTSVASGANVYSQVDDASAVLTGVSGAGAFSGNNGTSVANGVQVGSPAADAYLYSGVRAAAYAISKYDGTSLAHAVDVAGHYSAVAYSPGDIKAIAYSGSNGTSLATGITLGADDGFSLLKAGDYISALAESGDNGTSVATGAYVDAQYASTAYTYDTVDASAQSGLNGASIADAIEVHSANANAYLYAYGQIGADAVSGDNGVSLANGAVVDSDNFDAYSHIGAEVDASALAGAYGVANASAIDVSAVNGNAYSYNAGIHAYATTYYKGVSLARGATVTADGYAYETSTGDVMVDAYSTGFGVSAAYGFDVYSASSYAYLYNGGAAYVSAESGDHGVSHAEGGHTVGPEGATTINAGHLEAYALSGAYGNSYALGSATLSNAGDAYLFNSANTIVAVAISGDHGTSVANASIVYGALDSTTISVGDIYAYASSGDYGTSAAIGNSTTAGTGYAFLSSGGDIYAGAVTGYTGTATAVGADVDGPLGATTISNGSIVAHASGDYGSTATAVGSITNTDLGNAYLYAYGLVDSYAYGSAGAAAMGSIVTGEVDGYTYNGYGIYATAIATDATAVAIGAQTSGNTGDAVLYSEGNIGASASGFFGAVAMGSLTQAPNFAGTYAYGDIYANAYAYDGDALAMGTQTQGNIAETFDNGSISAYAHAYSGDATATGALTVGTPYAGLFGNGDIYATAVALVGDATASGAVTVSDFEVFAYNGGNIAAYAYTVDGIAMATGAYTVAPSLATFDTEGYLGAVASSYSGPAVAVGGYTTANIATSIIGGDVYASAYSYADVASATGIYNGANLSYVYHNAGAIEAHATSVNSQAVAHGINAYGQYYSHVGSDGSVYASADGYDLALAIGIASTTDNGDSYVNSAGYIDAYADAADGQAVAVGIGNTAGGYGWATVDNSADISAQATADGGVAFAFGINDYSYTNSALVDSSGVVYAGAYADYGTAVATGLLADAPGGEAHVYNSGAVAANASAYDGTAVATGSSAGGIDYATTDNYGTLIANADVGDGPDGIAVATGSNTSSDQGDGDLYNDGLIGAYANGGYFAQATGANVYGYTGAYAENGDTVIAQATSAGGNALATGMEVHGHLGDGGVYNYGLIQATATGYAAGAIGARADSDYYSAYMENSYQVRADAYGDEYAGARGAMAVGYDYTLTSNSGTIHAYAYSGGESLAIGSITHSDNAEAALDNHGLVEAEAYGYEAFAYDAIVDGYTGSSTYNDGDIVATATGYVSLAIGLDASTDNGDVALLNYGNILANAYGDNAAAVAVRMEGYGYGNVYNAGTIAAYGDGMRRAIQGGDYLTADIVNYGDVIGSVGTGNYGDSFFNGDGGYWLALQSSDFGDGDDVIVNDVGGVIVMPGSAIYMGGYSADGNAFYNYGTIVVLGDALIDMGGNFTLAPGANPLAFYNSGTITMVDGHPDDSLTIYGDFTGDGGNLNVDVNLGTGDSDRLYITGDDVGDTSQTINIALAGNPTATNEFVPIVDVNDGADGDWVLGSVSGVPNDLFYDLNLSIVHHTGTPDQFGLGIEIPGLNTKGLAALGIGPALQNAWHAITGTLFQREGTDREGRLQGFALWGRVFKNDGKLDPDAGDTNIGPDDDRKVNADTSGGEAGLAYNFNDAWSVGLLLSTQNFDIDTAGGGNSDGDGNGWGVYATYAPGAFYADLIYREVDFDLKANTAAGGFREKGTMDGWSLELGYAFTTSSGWKIEPQAQYSSMTIDGLDDITSGWGNWSYEDTDSTRLRLGVAFRKTFATDDQHNWTPYLSINAVDEMDGKNKYSIDNGTFFGGDDVGGTSTLVELGATGRIDNWTLFGGLNFQQGGGYRNTVGGQLGVRYTFAQPTPAPVAPPPPPAKTCADLDDDGDGINNCDDKCATPAGQAVGPDGCPVPAPEPAPEPKPYRG